MNKPALIFTFLVTLLSLVSCNSIKESNANSISPYIPEDKELYNTIVAMDETFFEAYNNCDLEKQATIYADNIEFYHDKGGLMTSKKDLIDATEKNICGKVTRELVKESIEVYPIKDYGAVEIGYHKFYNNQEPNALSHPGKFIIMWQRINNHWKITKVISLH